MRDLPLFSEFRVSPLDVIFNAVCNHVELYELTCEKQEDDDSVRQKAQMDFDIRKQNPELVPFLHGLYPTLITKYLRKFPHGEAIVRPISLEVATKLRLVKVLARHEIMMLMMLGRSNDDTFGDVSDFPHNMVRLLGGLLQPLVFKCVCEL